MFNALRGLARTTAIAATMVGLAGAAQAQDFPTHSIRLVVGFAAGGASDVAARVIAQKMGEYLGQQIVIENKPGASTSIAGDTVAKAAPDGYMLFQAGNANAVNAIATPKPPFDILTDFEPVGIAITSPSILVAHPSANVKTMKELIAKAKAEPGAIMYASSGAAAVSRLAGEMLAYEEKIKLTHVPYKGSSQAMNDLLAGRVQIMFSPISTALPLIKEGKLVALAVTSAQREKDTPDVPTLVEAGVKPIDMSIWSGFVAPKGTPPDRIAKLADALQKALKSDEVHKQLAMHGITPAAGGKPEDWTRRMKGDIEKLEKLVAETGLKIGQ
ncbi:MAG: tripartite tricarboxylate transporter substrate binding protein [Pseudolabrys sp.]|nr:tripartite tricarboxylate transporter substrate binding protein [Pseudolabrys sp.]